MSVVVHLDSIGWEGNVARAKHFIYILGPIYTSGLLLWLAMCPLWTAGVSGFFGRAVKCKVSLHNKIM